MKVTFSSKYSVFAVQAEAGTLVSLTSTPTTVDDGIYTVGDNGVVIVDEGIFTDSIYLSTTGTDYTVDRSARIATVAEGVQVWAGTSAISCPFPKSGKGGGDGETLRMLGATTTPLSDGATTNPIIIDGEQVTAVKNDVAIYDTREFYFGGTSWSEFGGQMDTTPTLGSANAVTSDGIYAVTPTRRGTGSYSVITHNDTVSASGFASSAFGAGTNANQKWMTAIGVFNQPRSGDLFNIGNGGGTQSRSNILEANLKSVNVNGALQMNGVNLPVPYTTMPTITADMLGQIAQYVGATDSTYTQGYFYIAASDGAAEPTYSWVNLPTSPRTYSETVLYNNDLSNDPETSVVLSAAYTGYDALCLCFGKKGSSFYAPFTACGALLVNGNVIGLSDEVGYANAEITDTTHITVVQHTSGYGVYKVIGIKY